MVDVSDRCAAYAERISRISFVEVRSVYQPNEDVCVIDFVDRQFPSAILESRTYGHFLSSVSADLRSGFVEFNINKYVPNSRDVAEFYLPESVCGPRIHVVFEKGAKRVGVQGVVDSFDDVVDVINQYFQPL